MDEVAQIPDEIINLVIIPMMNTRQDPFDTSGRKNHLVMASSAYYQFNHLYDKYLNYKEKSNPKSPEYDDAFGLHVYSVYDMPDGWMDAKVIQLAKEQMTEIQFQMEYECLFPAESDGFFPAKLMNGARKPYVEIELSGTKGAEYVIGIDPARTGDNFAMVVLKLGHPNKIVACYALNKTPFPDMHRFVRDRIRAYNSNGGKVVRIHMDNGGGGLTLKDMLAEEYAYFDGETSKWISEPAIIDIDDEEQQYLSGERILKMQVFHPKDINTMNFDLRADLEKNRVILPSQPQTEEDEGMRIREAFDEIEDMITETMTIVSTPLKSGFLHFDTPKQKMKKDRYSAFILACQGARELQRDWGGPPAKVLARGFSRSSFLAG
ncbi:MAG: hypothetical protein ABS939_10785 [Psychrobacillus sp.]